MGMAELSHDTGGGESSKGNIQAELEELFEGGVTLWALHFSRGKTRYTMVLKESGVLALSELLKQAEKLILDSGRPHGRRHD